LWILSLALAICDLVFVGLGWHARHSSGGVGGYGALLPFVVALAFTTIGALVASRRSENAIGWIFCVVGLVFLTEGFALSYANFALFARSEPLPGGNVMAWASAWVGGPGLLGIFAFLLLLFPDGRLPNRRWRPVAWLSAIAIAVVTFAHAFGPGPLRNSDFPSVTNPFGVEALAGVRDLLEFSAFLLMFATILASAVSLVGRFRRARTLERQQIKWFAFAGAFLAAVFLAGPTFLWSPAVPGWIWTTAFFFAVAGMPISAGIAILRYRLYDIDLLINLTLVYGSLTAALVALYFGAIVVLQRIFVLLTGEKSTLAVVASTLVIAALFTPLRRGIQSFIDRRFYRRKYDARRTLVSFSATLRDETDLEALNKELVGVVRETMQPAHVFVWLRPDAGSKEENKPAEQPHSAER
jgi:hypothetical protein